jgi:hypothetical protein
MTESKMKTYSVGVIERALAYYEVEAEDARAAAENWQEGEFEDRDDEALDTEGPCSVREQQADGSWRKVPASEWEDAPAIAVAENKAYSVLLLYPDYANDSGAETYYAFVEATDATNAVAVAQQHAVAAQIGVDIEPNDFAVLLVTSGYTYGEALFNK